MSNLRVAIVGCGSIARQHVIRYHAHPHADLAALADVVPGQKEAMQSRLEAAKADPGIIEHVPYFTDVARMYEEIQPDAVSICTPHTLHYDHCCQALEAGCHVMVEKPMVTSLAHAVDLEKWVARSGKQLQIGYITPARASCQRLRQLCRNREYGDLKVVNCHISQPWYEPTHGSWRQQPELSGGGMIYDSGAHVLNTLVWTVESDVEVVHAFVDNLDAPVDINGTINVRFTNGVIACVAVCGQATAHSSGTWNFEHGSAMFNPWNAGPLTVFARRDGKNSEVDAQVTGEDTTPQDNFIDTVRGNAEPATSPRNGVIQSQLIDAIYESARSGSPAKPPR